MKKNSSYTEFNRDESTVSFTSKSRKIIDKIFVVPFINAKALFKAKFMDEIEDPFDSNPTVVEEPKEEKSNFEIVNLNKKLFNENADKAKKINRIINENKEIDYSNEKKELVNLLYDLRNSKDDYSNLQNISKKLNILLATVENKKKKEAIFKAAKTVVEEPKTMEQPKVSEEAKIMEQPKSKTNVEYKRMYLGKSKNLSNKITELQSIVEDNKKNVQYYERKIQNIDEIIKTENLDSREIRLYESVKSDYKDKLEEAKTRLAESEKAVKNAEKELSLYMQEKVDYYVDGKVYKQVSRREALDYLESQEKLELVIKKKRETEKLEREIAALKAKLAEKEVKLNNKEEEITNLRGYSSSAITDYSHEQYHEILVNMHKNRCY